MKSKLPVLARPAVRQPRAARDQLDVQAWEGGLLDLARVNFPTVRWWHGYRAARDLFGSYCYVCEKFTVTWAGRWGPPDAAKLAIHEHKSQHRAGKLPGGTITE